MLEIPFKTEISIWFVATAILLSIEVYAFNGAVSHGVSIIVELWYFRDDN